MYVSNVPHVSNFICEQSYMCVIVHTTGQIKYLVSCILYLVWTAIPPDGLIKCRFSRLHCNIVTWAFVYLLLVRKNEVCCISRFLCRYSLCIYEDLFVKSKTECNSMKDHDDRTWMDGLFGSSCLLQVVIWYWLVFHIWWISSATILVGLKSRWDLNPWHPSWALRLYHYPYSPLYTLRTALYKSVTWAMAHLSAFIQ